MRDRDNPKVVKSKAFGIRMTRLRTYLVAEKHEYEISRQVLRSGTSIGANVKEAIRGQSKADFCAKMNIALKEASETEHWLEMLYEGRFIDQKGFDSVVNDCRELIKILTSIVRTTFKGKDE